MTGPHSIIALCFQQLGLAHLSTVDSSSTKQAIIMMDTTATQFSRLTIKQEALFGRKRKGTHTEGNYQGIVFAGMTVIGIDRNRTVRQDFSGCAITVSDLSEFKRR